MRQPAAYTILLLLQSQWIFCQTSVKPAIRIRMNKGIFEQASSIVAGLVEYEVPRVTIPNTQQCFTEGCVQIHSFQMTSFRQPTSVSFQPSPPNRFAIRVTDFDFYVQAQLSGTIQVIISLPVAGTVYVSGQGISVTAYLDLQKTLGDEPYLRFLQCQIDSGFIDTRVANMGIFTDTVNSKYRATMSGQSRQQLEEAICNNMHRLSQQHFSSRISRLPAQISAKDLVEMMLDNASSETVMKNREKRAAPDYYDDVEPSTAATVTRQPADRRKTTTNRGGNGDRGDSIAFKTSDINKFFNVKRLSHILIDLTLLDAFSTSNDFTIGMAGSVMSTKSPGSSPYDVPFPYRMPQNEQRRQIEIIVSKYTIDSMMYQAHRTNSLLFHVDSKTPGVGTVLKTTCSMDEVCLSDQIEEVGTMYPDKSLELIIRSTKAPTARMEHGALTLEMAGRCLFFLEGTRQKVGVIPFNAAVRISLRTEGSIIRGSVSIIRLTLDQNIDFFGLTASDLDGFRSSVQIALENMANKVLKNGVPINTNSLKLPMRFTAAHFSIVPEGILVQANLDLYNSLYGQSAAPNDHFSN